MDDWWNKIDSKHKEMTLKYSTLLTSFYVSTTMLQKILGIMKIHSGRHSSVLYSMGLLTLTSSAILADINSNMIYSYVFPNKNKYLNIFSDRRSATSSNINITDNVEKLKLYYKGDSKLRYTYISIISFIILEQLPIPFVSMLHTLLPSSILTYGVFARSGPFGSYIGSGSIPATAAAATDNERKLIQSVGRWRGCHHCGSRIRQLVTPKGMPIVGGMGYISDHMPPTKVSNMMNNVWWRKLLNIQIKQRLYPQCKPCFQLQGEAVRKHIHTVVYHYGLRPCHFAPLVAVYICDNFKSDVDVIEIGLINYFDDLKKQFKNILK